MKKLIFLAAAAAALSAAVPVANAQNAGIKLGVLECTVRGGTGFIVGSTKELLCTFTSADGGTPRDNYHGTISKIGLDVGTTGNSVLAWAVLAPSKDILSTGTLAGSYYGATAEAAVVVGAGANLLVGGSNQSFMLQPLSVQANTGVNAALAVTGFHLQPAAG